MRRWRHQTARVTPTYCLTLNNFGKSHALRTFPHEHVPTRHAACAFGTGRPVKSHFGTKRAQAMSMKNALVPLTPRVRDTAPAPSDRRANADFVAHLIATAVQAPQTRARRRADPSEALAAYRSLSPWPTEAGRTVSRSL
jgi:hypothetical protein